MPHADAARHERVFRKGASIHQPGNHGIAWRIAAGAVRLDRIEHDDAVFCGIAIAGDVIGTETLLTGHYASLATALTPCTLQPWVGGTPSPNELLQMLAQAEQRAGDLVNLRHGSADERIYRLLALLRRSQPRPDDRNSITLPSLRDIADITGLTVETSSRVLSRMRRNGLLGQRIKGAIQLVWPLSAPYPAFN